MFIHKSHSKKDLTNIIETFNIDIDNPKQYKKKELLKLLHVKINQLEEIEPDLKYYMFYNIIELKDYLSKCNPKKLLSVKDKNSVILQCKAIQQYVNNNYQIDCSSFKSIEELQSIAKSIEPYGDIPSVRRACRCLNLHPCKLFDLKPIISKQTQAELKRRSDYKKKYPTKLVCNFGHFVVSFD